MAELQAALSAAGDDAVTVGVWVLTAVLGIFAIKFLARAIVGGASSWSVRQWFR